MARDFGRYGCDLTCVVMERGGRRSWIEHPGKVSEIGETGCFVRTDRRPIEGEHIGIRIHDLSGEGPTMNFFGLVVHRTDMFASEVGFGIEFETATPQVQSRLEVLVDALRHMQATGGFRSNQAEEAERATFNRNSVDLDEAAHAHMVKTIRGKKMEY